MSIAQHLIHEEARAHDWRVVEHHDELWSPLPEYNRDRPDDKFRPYGATPGHGLEWSRLLARAARSLADRPPWLVESAVALFDQAVGDGWRADGSPGFVYTTDWDGSPVTRTRMHWVMAEAVLAADALARAPATSGSPRSPPRGGGRSRTYFVDRRQGSWRHELTPEMEPSSGTWDGKPDVYHAYQACLLPSLPPTTVASVALSNGVGLVRSADWDARYAASESVWGAAPNRWVEQETAALSPGRALDLACGEGRNAAWLAARGWTVTGVDFSAIAIDKARAHTTDLPTTWVCDDVVTWTPPAASFDLVLVVYLHLPATERDTVLDHAVAALAPGGHLVVVAHDLANLTDGVGGPQDATVLATASDVTARLGDLQVLRAGTVERQVDGADRPAIDTLVHAVR